MAEQLALRLWICTDHDHHYPVGCASVVVAETEEAARQLLDRALLAAGLKPSPIYPYTLQEVPLGEPQAVILCDGNY